MVALRRTSLHALAFVPPLYSLAWGLTVPHQASHGWWLLPLIAAIAWDFWAPPVREQPEPVPSWPFDAALYGLSALQLVNVALLVRAMVLGVDAWETLEGVLLVGSSSGYSAIVVAHELVHRPQAHFRQLGRLLLCTVLYEHFATEHVRGHHKRVATGDDPATARFGERLWPFVARTVPAQLRSAWRLECKRLGDVDLGLLDQRQLHNRVLQGLVVGWGTVALLLALGGIWAALAFVLQAAWAVLLLEAVNYIEHWGLERAGSRVTTVDSWDSESSWTYYTLVGLSRHADHHANAARPYQDLRWFDESPKMPWGYWATAITAIFANPWVRSRYEAELRRRELGPFRVLDREAA
ncbi:MAG: fatty acid desaturase [Myxococcales bacterium]|nr:fatty acid desaturase [Myxococcales bacterium]